MQDTLEDKTKEDLPLKRGYGHLNRNGQHIIYLAISLLFLTLFLTVIVNFLMTGHFDTLLFVFNILGLLGTMYCHTRYFRRRGERAPWHEWKIFKLLRQ